MAMTDMRAVRILAAKNGGQRLIQVEARAGWYRRCIRWQISVALQVLRRGGNAVDATVALGAAISVISHDWSGIAADSAWQVYWAATGQCW